MCDRALASDEQRDGLTAGPLRCDECVQSACCLQAAKEVERYLSYPKFAGAKRIVVSYRL